MFDAKLRPIIDPFLNQLARGCIFLGLTANKLTIIGFGFGVICGLYIYFGFYYLALASLVINRVCDGLDGAVARRQQATDFGGFLDIVCDFLFYSLVPFAFAISQPETASAAIFLMFSFVGTGTSFLSYAIFDAKRGGGDQPRQPKKSFFYLGGLTEGGETIAVFVCMLLFPSAFIPIAYGFGCLCWLTTGYRIHASWAEFGKK